MGASPVLRLGHFSYAFPGGRDLVLREICLDVYPGQCHCLTGPTGCGKTTLLMAVRGLLPPGRQSGTIDILGGMSPNGTAAAGIVFQNPVTQLISPELGAEVAFGLENHGLPPAQMPATVRRVLDDVGLDRSFVTPVAALSMGQKYRACLAGTLAMRPSIVLLDEPGAQLDPAGLARLTRIIAHLKSMGKAILVCEHRPGFLMEVTDSYWRFTSDGRLRDGSKVPGPGWKMSDGADLANATVRAEAPSREKAEIAGGPCLQSSETAAIRVQQLTMPGCDNELNRPVPDFCVAEGQRVAVCGPNGAGKTTLVRYLTGVSEPSDGTIEIFGAAPEPGRLRGTAGVLFQNPRRQLFATTVFEEVAFAARRRRGQSARDVDTFVRMLLAQLDLGALADQPPHCLSYGQKHLVSLAAVLAGEPRLLILDDPLAGLDENKARRVLELLIQLNKKDGVTVLCTGHHQDPWAGWADRVIRLAPGAVGRVNAAAIDLLDGADPAAAGWSRKTPWPIPTGAALAISIGLSMAAFAARSIPLLTILTGINLGLLLLRCTHPAVLLRRSLRFFVWQASIITLLYGMRFGWHSGWASGLRVAWQLFLAFWPGMIFTASNPASRVTRTLSRVLPHQTAFVVSACLHFLPLLLGEMNAIRHAQIFRGAGLLRADLKNPRLWPDWLHCLLVPTLVRALSLASDISLAAAARDFGMHKQRTYWPGDP